MASSSKPKPAAQPTAIEEGGEELEEQQQIIDLPPRQALSIVDPGIFGVRVPGPGVAPTAQPPRPPVEAAASAGESQT